MKGVSCVAVLIVVLLLCSSSNGSSTHSSKGDGNAPQAVVHIGPHKTGSTHLQSSIKKHSQGLIRAGYRFIEHHTEEFQSVAGHGPVHSFLSKSLSERNNVIYTSENLFALGQSGINALRDSLSGFSVLVVMVYREPLSRLLSNYNHLTREFRSGGLSVEEALATTLSKEYNMESVTLNRYIDAFGLNNTIVLDYFGMLAAYKDEAQIFICEIIGILCDEFDSVQHASTSHENSAANDLLPYQLVFELMVFAGGLSCYKSSTVAKQMEDILKSQLAKSPQLKLPEKDAVNNMFLAYSKSSDSKFRQMFHSIMRYDNATANDEARAALHYTEIDTVQLRSDPQWRQWMESQVTHMRQLGLIIDCKDS